MIAWITPVSCSREEALGDHDVEKGGQRQRAERDQQQRQALAVEHPVQRAAVALDDRCRSLRGCSAGTRSALRLGSVLQQRAHIIGTSVSETTAEIRMVTASVMANSRNSRPTTSPMNSSGISTAISETVSEMMVKPICSEPFERGLQRRFALLDVARDVLDHDDGVVDHEAGRDRQRHQRQVVEAEAEQVHRAEGADQRQRHRQARDDGGARRCAGTRRSPARPAPRRAPARTRRRCTEARMVVVRSVSTSTSIAAGQRGLQLRQQRLDARRPPR